MPTQTYDNIVNPRVHKFGRNSATASTGEVVSDLGGALINWPQAGGTLSCVSSGTTDKAAGKGVASITVQGLDTSYNAIEVNVNLSGTLAVTNSTIFLRIHRVFSKSIGSAAIYGAFNSGNISVNIGGTTVAQINAGKGQTAMAQFTVPVNMKYYIDYLYASVLKGGGAAVAADIGFYTIDSAEKTSRLFHEGGLKDVGSTHFSHHFFPSLEIPAKADIYVLAVPTVNAIVITAGFGGKLVRT